MVKYHRFGALSLLAGLILWLTACTTAAAQPGSTPQNAQRSLTAPQSAASLPIRTPLPTQAPVTGPSLSAEAKAFNVTANNFRASNGQLLVDVCINLPDTQDWMVGRASVQVNGTHIDQSGGSLFEYRPAGSDGAPGRRCDSLSFELPINLEVSQAILTIDQVSAYPREGQYCAYLLGAVQKILDERKAGILLACSEQPGYADAKVVRKPDSLSQAEAERIAFSPEYYSVTGPWSFPDQAASGVPTITPYPTVALDDPRASPYALLQTLNQKAGASLAVPGWVYVREDWQHDIDSASYGTLADGTPLPKAYWRETWYRIDENGRVIQSVSLLHTTDGQLVETTVYTSGTYWSSSAPERYSQQPYRLHLNELYTGNVQANLSLGRGSSERTELDGQPAILFTLVEALQDANPSQYSQPIQGDVVSTYFDPDSGMLRFLKTVVILADGSERAIEQMRLRVLRGIEPPGDVLDLLAKTQRP